MFDSSSAAELVEVIAASRREEGALLARRAAAVAELLARRTAEAETEDPDCGYMLVTGLQRTSAEVAAAMNLPPGAASLLVSQAQALDARFPQVAAALAAGHADWPTVAVVLARTDLVADPRLVATLDRDLARSLRHWGCWSRRRVITTVDAAVRRLDPDAVRQRQRAEDGRRLDITPRPDGTAKVDGVLTAAAASVAQARIAALAAAVCRHDPRTLDQRRADAMAAMAAGTALDCGCGRPDCPIPPAAPAARIELHVLTDSPTMLGEGPGVGYLDGLGVLDADQIRDLATEATVRPLAEPAVTAEQARRYQPCAALERWVRARDLTCRFPGCERRAAVCDLDHTVPFCHTDPDRGGLTTAANLKCLCRQHHRLKTFVTGWRDQQLPDATVVWTSPAGRTYRTLPGSADLTTTSRAPKPGPCRTPTPRRHRPTDNTSHLARLRERNRRLRPLNEAHRALTFARNREIYHRKERNRHRDTMLMFMFKGHRNSTSPFMTWVNDPYEPEHLPPDWQPPPQPQQPDDPPF
jgi:hypothetical protein